MANSYVKRVSWLSCLSELPSHIEEAGEELMSLYKNINARKKAGTSRTKAKSTVTAKAYSNMKKGFPKKKKT